LIYIGEFSGGQAEVGIMNGAGNNGSGFYSTPGPLYGMPDISTLFVNNGTYVGAVDVNGNGRFGTYDTETGTFIPEAHEIMSGINVTYENDHFNVTGSYYDPVPEPVTGGLLIAGAAAALTRRRRYNSKK
jgi:hypothetical protein